MNRTGNARFAVYAFLFIAITKKILKIWNALGRKIEETMKRLIEHVGKYIRVKGCETLYPNAERKAAPASNAIVRLAAYEDAMPLERAQELAELPLG